MLKFYKKIFSVFFSLVVLTVVLTLICLNRGFVSDVLLPVHESAIPWKLETTTDVQKGGTSSVSVNDSSVNLDYDYLLTEDVQYPHVSALVAFAEMQNAKQLVDLSDYSAASFRVKCAPRNVLAFYLHSLDPLVTDSENFFSYRIAETFFSCKDEWSEVEVDLRHLNVAEWWLETFGLEISDQNYHLDRVIAFSFCATGLGPVNTAANIKISELTLHRRDWRYVWALAGSLAFIWAGFMFWLLRQYTQNLIADVKKKLQKGRPLMAYQQLSIEPHKDREKTLLLQFIATEYANPDLSVEGAVATLGINRTKINDILKKELGFTFTAYVNKLRLTEAARLLSEKDETSVADIAYRVGYNNVTYFNKLFKSEYGYAPKTFKKICSSNEAGVLRSPGVRDDDQA
jgi:AraC-like DNA-binding protein